MISANSKTITLKEKTKKFFVEIRKKKKVKFFKQSRKMFIEKRDKALKAEQALESKRSSGGGEQFESQVMGRIQACLTLIDEAYKVKNAAKLAEGIRNLRLLTSCATEVSKFPYKELYFTKSHLVILNCLDPETNLGDRAVVKESLWMMSNLMLAPKQYLTLLLEQGLVAKLARFLDVQSTHQLKSVFWSLANLLGELPNTVHAMVRHGFMDFLLDYSEELLDNPALEETVAWFISNVFRQGDLLNGRILTSLMDRYLELLFADINSEAVPEMLTALKDYLDPHSDSFVPRLKLVLSKNPLERLVELGHSKVPYVRFTSLKVLGVISSGPDRLCERMVSEQMREMLFLNLVKFDASEEDGCSMYAVWIISNLVVLSSKKCMFFCTNELLKILHQLIQAYLLEFKKIQGLDEALEDQEKVVNNNQFNVWNLLSNIYNNLEGQKTKEVFIEKTNLIHLLLSCLQLENIKIILFLLQFLHKILKDATKFYNKA